MEFYASPHWSDNLPPWLHEPVAGLAVWQWLGLGAIVLLSLFAGFIVRRLATKILESRYRHIDISFSPNARRGVRRGVAVLVAAALWPLLMPALRFPPEVEGLVYRVVQLAAVIASIWLVASLWDSACEVLMHRRSADDRTERLLIPVTKKFVSALIFIGGFLAILAVAGVNVMGVLAGLGIGGLVVALAAKDSVENLFGSLTILFDMPFRIGDWVKIGSVDGTVEEINLRSTRIRTFEDSVITLPNSNLIRASVENFGARRHRRQKFHLRFAQDTEPDALHAFITDLRQQIVDTPGTVGDKVVVELNEITDHAFGVLVVCHFVADTQDVELKMRSDLLSNAMRLAKMHGLRFGVAPPPQPAATAEPALVSQASSKVE